MTDLVLPAAVPMETYIDDTVAVLSEVLEDTPADVLGGFDFTAQGVWAFARPGSPPLKLDQSLDDAGVVDGSLLTLVSVSRTERYRPLVEDVIDAIAVLDESPEFDRTALNRFVGAAIPLLTAPVIGMAMRAWWETGRSLWWPLAIGILGIAVLVGSFVANRFYQSGHLAECLLVTTYLLIATAAALAVPLPRGVNSLGAPQVAGAATAVLFLTLMTRGGPRKRHELASFAVITAIAVIAAAAAFGYGYQDWVPAGGIAFGLFIVTNAAKLTVAVARIALPPAHHRASSPAGAFPRKPWIPEPVPAQRRVRWRPPSIRRLRHPQQPQRCRPGLPAAPSRTQRLLLSWPRQDAAARARSSNPVTYCQYSQSATATRWTAASVAVCAWCRAISCEWAA